MNIKNYSKCSQCGKIFLYKEMFLCDGILFKYKEIPFRGIKHKTCDRVLCKQCKHNLGGYDFCDKCYGRRK